MMRWTFGRVGAWGLTIALLTAGCSTVTGTVTGSGPTTAPNACDVLTADLAIPVIGTDATVSRRAQPNPHETQCQYKSASGAIDVMVGDWSFIKDQAIDPQRRSVPGIGDEATVSAMGLVAKKGDHGISVDVSLAFGTFEGDAATNLQDQEAQAEKDLAPKLLARL